MDRNTLLRWLIIAAVVFVAFKWVIPAFNGKGSESHQAVPEETYVNAPSFVPDVIDPATGDQKTPWQPPAGDVCKINGNRFVAELSSRGAGLTHFFLTDPRYATSKSADVSTTPDLERWRSLRTLFRNDGAKDDQLKYDRFNWATKTLGTTGCEFTYQDPDVKIVKTVTAGQRPFELNVDTAMTNLADAPKRHRFSIADFAYRTNGEMKGSLGRVSPFQTELSCARDGDVFRKSKDDFKEGPFSTILVDRFAAVSNYYFAEALVPLDVNATGNKPECNLLAEQWYGANQKPDAEDAGVVFHSSLVYPERTLQPNETTTYRQIAFFGPKERAVLAQAAGGTPHLGDLINLGFFSPVAKVLVGLITWIHAHITFGNWGLAIIVLTVGLRLCLFPLTFKSIKTSIAMRKLKPEIDLLNKKFKDDAQAKNLATMELYRKHKVNPFGGCLPQLVQMPVWFAMYTTLQTAVEMYNTKFLWFSDLSAPDHLFILPIVLGGFMILQQRIVPQQGMDPMQQKMMTWLLPGIFTVMMLFLPAALGVYMLTNSILGILQQLAVEKFAPRGGKPSGTKSSDILVKDVSVSGGGAKGAAAFGKGKARV